MPGAMRATPKMRTLALGDGIATNLLNAVLEACDKSHCYDNDHSLIYILVMEPSNRPQKEFRMPVNPGPGWTGGGVQGAKTLENV